MRRSSRKRAAPPIGDDTTKLVELLRDSQRCVVFSGSGISASAGVPTFSAASTGLYARARRKHGVKSGKDLFSNAYFIKHPVDHNAFIAEFSAAVAGLPPTRTHRALDALTIQQKLQRHYTLNIDGLSATSEATAPVRWSVERPRGTLVELHGNAAEVVCRRGHRAAVSLTQRLRFKQRRTAQCSGAEGCTAHVRWRVMLYDDAEADLITSPAVLQLIDADAAAADLVLFIGISFEQSASIEYLKRVAASTTAPMGIVNPDDEAIFNVESAVGDTAHRLLSSLQKSDEFFDVVAESMIENKSSKD